MRGNDPSNTLFRTLHPFVLPAGGIDHSGLPPVTAGALRIEDQNGFHAIAFLLVVILPHGNRPVEMVWIKGCYFLSHNDSGQERRPSGSVEEDGASAGVPCSGWFSQPSFRGRNRSAIRASNFPITQNHRVPTTM